MCALRWPRWTRASNKGRHGGLPLRIAAAHSYRQQDQAGDDRREYQQHQPEADPGQPSPEDGGPRQHLEILGVHDLAGAPALVGAGGAGAQAGGAGIVSGADLHRGRGHLDQETGQLHLVAGPQVFEPVEDVWYYEDVYVEDEWYVEEWYEDETYVEEWYEDEWYWDEDYGWYEDEWYEDEWYWDEDDWYDDEYYEDEYWDDWEDDWEDDWP